MKDDELLPYQSNLRHLYPKLYHPIQHPKKDDPTDRSDHLSARESIGKWRDSIPHYLGEQGTLKSCAALRQIADQSPRDNNLKRMLFQARIKAYSESWIPPQPDYILKMAEDQERRLVRDGDQLLDAVIESLDRLEEKLYAEIPAIRGLWDRTKKDSFKPIGEEDFSDFIAGHLKDDLGGRGLILGREVQIHRKERTDIHIDAITSLDGYTDPVSIIIEVKGCWNRKELSTSMEDQLVGRYLQNNTCQHGIYLVGSIATNGMMRIID